MDLDKLKKNFDYYLANKPSIIKDEQYYGKYLIIKDEKIMGAYDKEDEAIKDMLSKGHKMGDFIVQVALENDKSSVRFSSRVYV